MNDIQKPEELSSEDFSRKMASDPDFRTEMRRRQDAFIDKVELRKMAGIQRRAKAIKNAFKVKKDELLPPNIVFSNGGCPQYFIQRAPVAELRKAVKNKKLSAARFRIELRRRKDKEYYNNMPETVY